MCAADSIGGCKSNVDEIVYRLFVSALNSWVSFAVVDFRINGVMF